MIVYQGLSEYLTITESTAGLRFWVPVDQAFTTIPRSRLTYRDAGHACPQIQSILQSIVDKESGPRKTVVESTEMAS